MPCESWISGRSRRTSSENCVDIRPAVEDNTDPWMMLTPLIFNYAMGTRSSRKIMQRCEQDSTCKKSRRDVPLQSRERSNERVMSNMMIFQKAEYVRLD